MICRLPKAGLGNQLFPLLKAHIFGTLNELPVDVTGYHQLKIGPWIRGEKSKRKYIGYFTFQKNIIETVKTKIKNKINNNEVYEPNLEKMKIAAETNYVFAAMPHWESYFKGLKEHRDKVLEILCKIIRPEINNDVNQLNTPIIGVHVRRGDFRHLKDGEQFSRLGGVRTPENYFIDVIKKIRQINGSLLPVSIFSDGYNEEFAELLLLENLQVIEGNSDIVDMLLLSKSKIIVTSAGSTFSYWSAFLSEAPVIMHPDHIHESLRPQEINSKYYEGPLDEKNELLIKNIKAISSPLSFGKELV